MIDILSDEEIKAALDSRFGTDHERFIYVAQAQYEKDQQKMRELFATLDDYLSYLSDERKSGLMCIYNYEVQSLKEKYLENKA